MADTGFEGRWPFTTNRRALSRSSVDGESATVAVLDAAANATGTAPLELPVLNDRVDPDRLDALLAEGPSPGIRTAVEVSFGEVSVLLRDDGYVAAYASGRGATQLDPVSGVEHDWSQGALVTSIGNAIATAADSDPADVGARLLKHLDADAVGRLLRPRSDDTERAGGRLLLSVDGYEVAVEPTGSVTVEPSLAVLKRSGAALLVAGSAPEEAFDRVSSTLLGDADEARTPVFALHGRNVQTARRRLSMAGVVPSEATVFEHRASARAVSVTSADATRPVTHGPEVVPVSDGVFPLVEAVHRSVAERNCVTPGGLRLCVDSLQSMRRSTDPETMREAVDSLCRMLHEKRGIGHFLLPGDVDSDEVETLAPSFDAIVEVSAGAAGFEQQWQLTGTGHTTPRFARE